MKKLLLAAAALAAATTYASADGIILDDPLHGLVCSGASSCTNAADNGSFTPLGGTNFSFGISPGPSTGSLELVIGVPTDEINTGTFNLPGLTDNGGSIGTGAFSRVNFFNAASGGGTGLLSTYLGLSSFSPTDNFSNLSAGTAANDPGFGGNFLVFTVTLSPVTLEGMGGCDVSCLTLNDFNFGSNLPGGTFITGLFTDTAGNQIGTAASAHLVETRAVPGPIVGGGIPGLFALGMLVLARWRKRRGVA